MKTNIWTFKYEPEEINQLITTEEKKETLKKVINELPNTLIAGHPGTGKGTFMNMLIRKTGVDCLKINGSEETGIDMVRDKIKSFASAYSLNKKIVYINESDRISLNAQNSLNQILEDYQSITRFFFVCNNPDKISAPILSRCSYKIDLNDPPAKDIFNHIVKIFKQEKIKVKDKESVISVIKKLYPDIRQIIGTLQSNVKDGKIEGVSYSFSQDIYENILQNMLKYEIEETRKLLKSNYIDYPELFNHIYKEMMEKDDIVKMPAEFIIKLGEFLYKNEFVAIKEINFMTFMLTCMKEGII